MCAADQPLVDPSGRYRIVCNGRIFNAPDVAADLGRSRTALRTESILEVMLQAYRRWGVDAFARFNGAFACAIWDAHEQSLLLARDHLGIKPLFYFLSNRLLIFASEVKGVLAHPHCPRRADETGIAEYLVCHRLLLDSETTFYEGIKRLRPAHVLTVSAATTEGRRYWQIDPERQDTHADDDACVEATRDLLVDAVRIRLPDSKRVAAALSGGFDSSSVVCVLDHLNRKERGGSMSLDTFSFTFDDDEADERELIDVVAAQAGAVHHHVHVLRPDLFDDVDELIRRNDGPTLENGILLLWNKKKAVRQRGLDVLYSGLGGDELFMGDLTYFADLFRQGSWKSLYRELRSFHPWNRSSGKRTSLAGLLRSYTIAPLIPNWASALKRSHLGRPFPPSWMSRALIARTGVGRHIPRRPPPHFPTLYAQYCYDIFHHEIVSANLPYHDVTSATFAVDTRFPLMDVRLVEALFALPRTWKIHLGAVRMLQRRAMAFVLPPEVLSDHLKKDFHPTLNRFQRKVYREQLDDTFLGRQQLSGPYLDWKALELSYRRFVADGVGNPYPLWLAINLERWLKTV